MTLNLEAVLNSIQQENFPSYANIETSHDIPVIDARPLLHFGKTGQQTKPWYSAIDALKRALHDVGFFSLTEHGLDATQVKEQSRLYFAQPESYKEELLLTKSCQFGYSINERLYQTEDSFDERETVQSSDPKQSFNMPPPDSPLLRWPRSTTYFDSAPFIQAMLDYFRACEAFTSLLLPNIAYLLGEPDHYFVEKMEGHMSAIRSLFYPATDPMHKVKSDQMRASSHSDFGLMTLLQTFGTPGLQVLNRAHQWITVTTEQPTDLVVNIGDALSRMTNGTFRSTRHRVAPLIRDERQSVPYFVNFASDALVEVVNAYKKPTGNLPPIVSGHYIMAKNGKAHNL